LVWPVGGLNLWQLDAPATGSADVQDRRTPEEPAQWLYGRRHRLDAGYEPADDFYERLAFRDYARAIDQNIMSADELCYVIRP
jgi:hypothetical protein